MTPHGPDAPTFENATASTLKPEKFDKGLAFMFETTYHMRLTDFALEGPHRDVEYQKCWSSLKNHFKGKWSPHHIIYVRALGKKKNVWWQLFLLNVSFLLLRSWMYTHEFILKIFVTDMCTTSSMQTRSVLSISKDWYKTMYMHSLVWNKKSNWVIMHT